MAYTGGEIAMLLVMPDDLATFEQSLDFSAMLSDGSGDLTISVIKHKARIEVDRNGTSAAAATEVEGTGAIPPGEEESLEITIDKPFWHAIRDRVSGTVLFSGCVVDPTA